MTCAHKDIIEQFQHILGNLQNLWSTSVLGILYMLSIPQFWLARGCSILQSRSPCVTSWFHHKNHPLHYLLLCGFSYLSPSVSIWIRDCTAWTLISLYLSPTPLFVQVIESNPWIQRQVHKCISISTLWPLIKSHAYQKGRNQSVTTCHALQNECDLL